MPADTPAASASSPMRSRPLLAVRRSRSRLPLTPLLPRAAARGSMPISRSTRRCRSPSAGAAPLVSAGVRDSLIGAPTCFTGPMPGWSSSTTMPRARTSSESSTSSRSRIGSRQQSCSPANAVHSSRVRSLNTAATSAPASESGCSNCFSTRSGRSTPRTSSARTSARARRARPSRRPWSRRGSSRAMPPASSGSPRRGTCCSAEVARHDHRQPRQRAVGHRDVDELALARALALVQRGQDPDRRHQRRRRRGRRSGRRTGSAGRRAGR